MTHNTHVSSYNTSDVGYRKKDKIQDLPIFADFDITTEEGSFNCLWEKVSDFHRIDWQKMMLNYQGWWGMG